MKRTAIALAGTLATFAFAAPAQALTATTQSPANVTDTSATMRGSVDPGLVSVAPSYYFEYGETQAYGSKTPATVFALAATVKVSLVGLTPATNYHYRVVATGLLSTSRGADRSFKTEDPQNSSDGSSGSGGSSGDSGSGSGSNGSGSNSGSGDSGSSGSGSSGSGSTGTGSGNATGGSGSGGSDGSGGGPGDNGSGDDNSGGAELAVEVQPNDSVKPVLGSTVGAAPDTGSVEVRTPGSDDFTPLPDGTAIPVGSTIDARGGSVNVVTAVGSAGAVQTATFKGAVFQVKQSRKTGGLTDIFLRGGDFSSCRASRPAPSSTHVLAKKKKKHAIRKLWGHDHGGRFRTHGRGAIATVRGTTWVVADHCDGTRTSVLSGAVSVRDKLRHKTVLVHAGHSYFARTHR